MFIIEKLETIYRSRLLISNLVSRELKARYRGSFLGFFWTFLNPMLFMLVYTIAFGVILKPRFQVPNLQTPVDYSLFLFCGLLPWLWFSSSVLESANVLSVHGTLIKKVMFPVEVLPIMTVTANFVNFILGLPILILFFVIFGHPLNSFSFFCIPIIIIQYFFSLGLAFFVAALTVHFKDIENIVANLLHLWFFSTPIIYPFQFAAQKSKALEIMLLINPLTHIMEGYQYSFFFGSLPHYKKLSVTFIVSILFFLAGYYFFDRIKDTFAEEI